jgi:hypothetical protein
MVINNEIAVKTSINTPTSVLTQSTITKISKPKLRPVVKSKSEQLELTKVRQTVSIKVKKK